MPASELKTPPSKTESKSGAEDPFDHILLHPIFETNDSNANEIEAICEAEKDDDWDQACDEVAEYFARIRDWNKASEYADKPCQAGKNTSCITLAKINWQSTGSVEDAYLTFKRGCETDDGLASGFIKTVEYGTLVRTDRLACAIFRQHSDPQEGWNAILTMKYGAGNETFGEYFNNDF